MERWILSSSALKNKKVFKLGMIDGIPIALGYFAVAFSLGIAVVGAGITPLQGMITSLLCNASAGQYAGFTLIKTSAAFIEMALVIFIVNARYMLMSCALSQRIDPKMPFFHRFLIGYSLTDEIFAISIARQGYINPYYSYGAFCVASPCWALGTLLGAIAGNVLPGSIVSALGVALFGMFIAIFIPPAKKNKVIGFVVLISFILSYLAGIVPIISSLSEGMRTIILTVVISGAFALLFPKEDEDE